MTRWRDVLSIAVGSLVTVFLLAVPAATESSGLPFADAGKSASAQLSVTVTP